MLTLYLQYQSVLGGPYLEWPPPPNLQQLRQSIITFLESRFFAFQTDQKLEFSFVLTGERISNDEQYQAILDKGRTHNDLLVILSACPHVLDFRPPPPHYAEWIAEGLFPMPPFPLCLCSSHSIDHLDDDSPTPTLHKADHKADQCHTPTHHESNQPLPFDQFSQTPPQIESRAPAETKEDVVEESKEGAEAVDGMEAIEITLTVRAALIWGCEPPAGDDTGTCVIATLQPRKTPQQAIQENRLQLVLGTHSIDVNEHCYYHVDMNYIRQQKPQPDFVLYLRNQHNQPVDLTSFFTSHGLTTPQGLGIPSLIPSSAYELVIYRASNDDSFLSGVVIRTDDLREWALDTYHNIIRNRKLFLALDIDHTILEAHKEVPGDFSISGGPASRPWQLHIKLRGGVNELLNYVARDYEVVFVTTGEQEYAEKVMEQVLHRTVQPQYWSQLLNICSVNATCAVTKHYFTQARGRNFKNRGRGFKTFAVATPFWRLPECRNICVALDDQPFVWQPDCQHAIYHVPPFKQTQQGSQSSGRTLANSVTFLKSFHQHFYEQVDRLGLAQDIDPVNISRVQVNLPPPTQTRVAE